MYKWTILLFACLLCATATESQADCTPATGDPLVIATVFGDPGLLQIVSAEAAAGVDSMAYAVNQCGGVKGRPVELRRLAANNRPQAERAVAEILDQGIQIVVGSSSPAVSEVLSEAAAREEFVYWEVNLPLAVSGDWSFSPRPTRRQLGTSAATYLTAELPTLGETELRAALIWERLPRTSALASGVRDTLPELVIDHEYSESLTGIEQLSRSIRENQVNTVFVAAYDRDALRLWYGLQDADANIKAWVQLDSDGYRRTLCDSMTVEGFISVTAEGTIRSDYRRNQIGPLYQQYERTYLNTHGRESSPSADLSASGLYMLLHYVLPEVEGGLTADTIRETLLAADVPGGSGLMGEGLQFAMDQGVRVNARANAVIQQQQGTLFCSVSPAAGATCGGGLIPFPDWYDRERTLEGGLYCGESI